ncbi:MAG: hypothetical protein B7Y47_00050 [Sphingomonas sp. 28-63-12]|nr:MAG: hypothetical protein B7Y47_00050 [Sphingomonas sp. 28-63-12]
MHVGKWVVTALESSRTFPTQKATFGAAFAISNFRYPFILVDRNVEPSPTLQLDQESETKPMVLS